MSKARVYGYLTGFTPNCRMDQKRKKRPRKREGKRMTAERQYGGEQSSQSK